MKIFAVIPTRNDAWIIARVLASTSLWADQIIVADENSWDDTVKICKEFPKVQVVNFEPKQFNESYRRKVLLNTVRAWDGQNLVFGLDSDEILTAEILNPVVKESLMAELKPGMSAKFKWIMLWKNAREYRYDNLPEWSENYKHFVYWDDRKLAFDDVRMHSSRVPEAAARNSVTFEGVRVLHYAFAEWQRMLSKHVYYLALEKTMGSKVHPYLLNRKYSWFYKTGKGGVIIKELAEERVAEYKKRGVDVTGDIEKDDLYWYEAEVLRFFKEFGESAFKHYNIWDTDWENKRELAQKKGEKGLPQHAIKNVQPWYDRLYYKVFAPWLNRI